MRNLLDLIVHFWSRVFRGHCVSTAEHAEGGHLLQYASGYIEFRDKHGKCHDVHYDLYLADRKPRDWKLYAYGGGVTINLRNVTRDEAMRICAQDHGTVGFVDDEKSFIFFCARDWNPSLGTVK